MDYKSLVLLAVIHGLFDFVLQDRETAKNKSSSLKYLMPHLYLILTGLFLYTILSERYTFSQGYIFAVANTVVHGIIDWNIWKLYKITVAKRFPEAGRLYPAEKFEYYEDSMFYNFIYLDQLLHGLCYLGLDYYVRTL